MMFTQLRPLLLALALGSALPLSAAVTQSVHREFDNLGHLVKESYPNGSWQQYSYDALGHRLTRTDNLGRITRYSYDALNRLTTVTDPNQGVTRYDYDGRDNQVQVTDPRGLKTIYQYNGLDDLTGLISPDTGVSTAAYATDGQPATRTDAKQQTVKYRYDTAGRLDRLTYADQSYVSFAYGTTGTSKGKLQLIQDTQGNKISIPYDALGRPMGEWRTIAGREYITRENYDGAGRLKQRVYPSGRTITYSFNSAGQISQIQTQLGSGAVATLLSGIQYRPGGQAQSWSYGNGEQRTSSYDPEGHLTRYSLGDSSVTLSYDPNGRLTGQQISGGWWQALLQRLGLNAGQQAQYGYDNLDRLTSWQDGTTTQAYDYDANGNRMLLTRNGTPAQQFLLTTSNQLKSTSGPQANVYQYDANGSRISDSQQSYTYDVRGRLIAAGGASYSLNVLGQRLTKTWQGQTTLYHYDRQGHLIAESDEQGNTRREYVYLQDTPIAVIDFGAIRYIHSDHLGTARLVTDASKHPIWAWQGEPFGNTAPNEDPEGTGAGYALNLRFPGQYYDRETGNYYNLNRDYDPAAGRYLQSDPIGLAGGINTYAYVTGNPLSYSDPEGLNPAAAAVPVAVGAGLIVICNSDPNCRENMQRNVREAAKGAQAVGQACADGAKKAWNWVFSKSGVSEEDEAECFAQYERELDECQAYSRAYGYRWLQACQGNAFKRYQACRGH